MNPPPPPPPWAGAKIAYDTVIVPKGFTFPPLCLHTGKTAAECSLELMTFGYGHISPQGLWFRFCIDAVERRRRERHRRRMGHLAGAMILIPLMLFGGMYLVSRWPGGEQFLNRAFDRVGIYLMLGLMLDVVACFMVFSQYQKAGSFYVTAKMVKNLWGSTGNIEVYGVHPRVLEVLRRSP